MKPKTRVKIVHLMPTLERGGAEMSLLRMLPLINDNIESVFITLKDAGVLAPRFEEMGMRVIALREKHPLDIIAYWKLIQTILEIKPDLVVTHLLYTDVIGRLLLQWFIPAPTIASLATTYNFPRYRMARWFERLTHPLCRGYMANSEVVKQTYVKKFKVSARKITVVTTGMDIQKFQTIQQDEVLRQELGLRTNDRIIICVANLHTNKGHYYLLEAFDTLYRKHQNVKLLLVGRGEEESNLKRQANDYPSREAMRFLGQRSDVPQLLALSHIFALPTFFEGMCNAIMEAMASGLPIVTTDIPENRELVTHEKTGLLVPLRDALALAQALERLVVNDHLAHTLGQNAALHIQATYDLHESARHWKDYFLSMVNKHPI